VKPDTPAKQQTALALYNPSSSMEVKAYRLFASKRVEVDDTFCIDSTKLNLESLLVEVIDSASISKLAWIRSEIIDLVGEAKAEINLTDFSLKITYYQSESIKIGVHPRKGSVVVRSEDDFDYVESVISTDPKSAIRFLQRRCIMAETRIIAQDFVCDANIASPSKTAVLIKIPSPSDYISIDVDPMLNYTVQLFICGSFHALHPSDFQMKQWDVNESVIKDLIRFATNITLISNVCAQLKEAEFSFIVPRSKSMETNDELRLIGMGTWIMLPFISPLSPVFIYVENGYIVCQLRNRFSNNEWIKLHYTLADFPSFFHKIASINSAYKIHKQCILA
jgi:hypothetical protein